MEILIRGAIVRTQVEGTTEGLINSGGWWIWA